MKFTKDQEDIINQACGILSDSFRRESFSAHSSDVVKKYCQLKIAHLEHEVFSALYLDNQHRLITFSNIFRGTIDGANVYPREVAKEALAVNAAAVIFTHNHPSGVAEPSGADVDITVLLRDALKLLDIRVLDHIVVSACETVSLVERGLI